jgi:hypothetical protein
VWFLAALGLLLVNDHYLKAVYHKWFTRKLSDFAGLFVFAVFWTAVFGGRRLLVVTPARKLLSVSRSFTLYS